MKKRGMRRTQVRGFHPANWGAGRGPACRLVSFQDVPGKLREHGFTLVIRSK